MPAVLKVALAIVLSALVCAPAASASAASDREIASPVRHAVQDWKSAIRHSDGERACGRMTLRYRRQFIGAFIDSDPIFAGMGCASLIDAFGRRLYVEAEIKGSTPGKIRVHDSKCADWKRSRGDRFRVVKQDGRWKLAGAGAC